MVECCGDSTSAAGLIRVLSSLRSQQALAVIAEKGFHGELYLYEREEEGWRCLERMSANLGRNGVGKVREGDGKSPTGIFSLATAFGNTPRPEGSAYPYRVLTEEDYWVDDDQSRLYNRWVRFREGWRKDWRSAEWLPKETICYQHAIIVNYNTGRQPGKGSAIFLHVRSGENNPTQGCTAVSPENMIRILKWLHPDKKPVFIQGTFPDILAITPAQANALDPIPHDFAYVEDLIPDLVVDLKNAASANLAKAAILTKPAALALANVQQKLVEADLSLKLWAAYRPRQAVDSVAKRGGASLSSHSRGSSVDVTLLDLKSGCELDMGEPSACCEDVSLSDTRTCVPDQEKNRRMLRDTMSRCGFTTGNAGWGHFTLAHEPYPDQYFDFPAIR